MTKSIHLAGAGSGGTRNISGTNKYHTQLERELSDLHNKEASLVFANCYSANHATIIALAKLIPNLMIFSDQKNHASLIEGMRHSGAPKKVFRHNDVQHLDQLLQEADPLVPKIIIFESVYSMDGTIAPIKEICDLADKYRALTFIDEVHAVVRVTLICPHRKCIPNSPCNVQLGSVWATWRRCGRKRWSNGPHWHHFWHPC